MKTAAIQMVSGTRVQANLAAARALLEHTELPADQVVKKALEIAGELCIYTNMHHTVESL